MTVSDITRWISGLSSAVLLIVGLGYSIGFLIISTYLSRYGVTSYDFLQPRYVAAGFHYIVSTAALTAFLYWAAWFIETHADDSNDLHYRVAALVVIFIYLGALRIIPAFLAYETELSKYDTLLALLIFCISPVVIYVDLILDKIGTLPALSLWWKRKVIKTGFLKWIVLILLMNLAAIRSGYQNLSFFPFFILGVWFVSIGKYFQREARVASGGELINTINTANPFAYGWW